MQSYMLSAHLASIVDEAKRRFVPEVWLLEFGMSGMLSYQFVYQRLVCGLGEPAFLVHQGKNTNGLNETWNT